MSNLERTSNSMEREPHEPSNRQNRLVAEQVEVGLVLQEMLGTPAAAKYLYTRLIPLNLAMRRARKENPAATRHPADSSIPAGGITLHHPC
jgi:hypothetical protein